MLMGDPSCAVYLVFLSSPSCLPGSAFLRIHLLLINPLRILLYKPAAKHYPFGGIIYSMDDLT